MSIRKTGKTNTLLTMALISSWKYGTITAVIRQTEEMIEYRNIKSFFEVQTRNNYISIITGGEFTGVKIKGDYAYFVHYDENMKIDKYSDPVVYFMEVDSPAKSCYNSKVLKYSLRASSDCHGKMGRAS